MRELLLLRHGKSDWSHSCSDFDRPLNARGQRDVACIGRWMHDHRLLPDLVFSSPARRAAQTAEAICAGTGSGADTVRWIDELYLASLETLLDFVAAAPPKCRRIMLIGHNPGLEDLLEHLAPEAERHRQKGKLLGTATLACLLCKGDWSQVVRGNSRLHRLIRPRELYDDKS